MHHPLARRSDFAITSVGSAGRVGRVLSVSTLRWVFRFNVWVLYPLASSPCTWTRISVRCKFRKYLRRSQLAFWIREIRLKGFPNDF